MDEDNFKVKKGKSIHYGSLEEKERQRLKGIGAGITGYTKPSSSSTNNPTREFVDLEDASVNQNRQQLLDEIEWRRKSRQITVSVDDVEVRAHLRHLDHPICKCAQSTNCSRDYFYSGLFGEGPADRRERLRQLLARLGQDALKKSRDDEKEAEKDKTVSSKYDLQITPKKLFQGQTTWYHEGSEDLRIARYWIASYSIPRASERIANEKLEKTIPETTRNNMRQELYKNLRTLEINCSQVGDVRPISSCQFSPDTSLIATSSWSGLCKIWSVPDLQLLKTFRGHKEQAGCIKFHPHSKISISSSAINLASSASDGSVLLWSLESEEPLKSLSGHDARVSNVDFHPSGRFLGTCCYDKSWRLWDLEKHQEILYQEGHSQAVHDISFQIDGSLAATGGLDSYGRIWDLRTGRCIMFMEGHSQGITSIDFSPSGYQVVTGSKDNTIRVWNIRNQNCEYTIPAHNNIVSRVQFDKSSGNFITSASYDNSIKIWAHPNWAPLHTLSGHDNKIMGLDVSRDNKYLLSSSYDRTFKLWTPETTANTQ